MPGPNLTPRTAGCVIDHAEAPNRCQQPRGRVHNPPLGRVEPKYHLLQGRFSITSGLRVIQARPPKVTGGLVRLGRVFHSPLLKVASARIIPCVSFTTCFQVLTPLKLFHVPPLKNITLAPKLNNPSPIRHDFSAGCGYDEADQPVFVGRCDTGIYLARCRGSEAGHRSWRLHVSRCLAGRTYRLAPEHNLAEANFHCSGPRPGSQAALARALEIHPTRAICGSDRHIVATPVASPVWWSAI